MAIALVVSMDRPMQLDATLQSFARHCRDAESVRVKVIYKATTSRMLSLYRRLMQEHPAVDFIREGNYRSDTLTLVREADYVMFVVDDTVFVRDFSMMEIVDKLRREPQMLGFSLRLGRNTTHCYTMNKPQRLPAFQKTAAG